MKKSHEKNEIVNAMALKSTLGPKIHKSPTSFYPLVGLYHA
ncbi:hypothetical protein [Neobacillus niacini]|nr:hypothetical protein [Neobacillus niacini]